jgi:predicted nuclease with TOPRIM domain
MGVSNRSKIIFLVILIVFLCGISLVWLDSIGLFDFGSKFRSMVQSEELSLNASGDEPSLIEKEEFEKEKAKLIERIEELDKREALLTEREKELNDEKDKLEQMKKGQDLARKEFEAEVKKYSDYRKNVAVLANKMSNMPPQESVKIIANWEETLIIDVLRQMDTDSEAEGRMSITPYLLTLSPLKEKASRIMSLMTQL